jgi:hypothetical protein
MNRFPNTSSIQEIQKRIADLTRKRIVLPKDDPELLKLELKLLDAQLAARADRRRDGHSGYDPLREYLMNAPEKRIHLQFHEIEKILGRPLPIVAWWCESWWEGGGAYAIRYLQCKAWRAAGRVARVNVRQRSVEFITQN